MSNVPELTKTDGGVICYDDQGPADAPAFVLIEGLSAHMLGWRDGFIQPLLDAGYRVVRFDNRDVGLSQHYPQGGYSLQDMSRDTHELITKMGLAPAHVVGQSMGGMVAQHLALEYPQDLASLTLLYTAPSTVHIDLSLRDGVGTVTGSAATTREEAIELHIQQERFAASTSYTFDEAWKRELGGLMWDRAYDPDGVERQGLALLGHSLTATELARIAVPTLIIHGTADRLISHTGSEELHHGIPESNLWLVEGMGHDLPRELWPELTSRIIGNAQAAEVQAATPEEQLPALPVQAAPAPGSGPAQDREGRTA